MKTTDHKGSTCLHTKITTPRNIFEFFFLITQEINLLSLNNYQVPYELHILLKGTQGEEDKNKSQSLYC